MAACRHLCVVSGLSAAICLDLMGRISEKLSQMRLHPDVLS